MIKTQCGGMKFTLSLAHVQRFDLSLLRIGYPTHKPYMWTIHVVPFSYVFQSHQWLGPGGLLVSPFSAVLGTASELAHSLFLLFFFLSPYQSLSPLSRETFIVKKGCSVTDDILEGRRLAWLITGMSSCPSIPSGWLLMFFNLLQAGTWTRTAFTFNLILS